MRKALFILLVVSLGVFLASCTITGGQEPAPTVDIQSLNDRIASLQIDLQKAQLDIATARNQQSGDKSQIDKLNNQINDLNTQIAAYQEDVKQAEKLDSVNWIYPAKIGYTDYVLDVVCVYFIKVHNGSDQAKEFRIFTEPYLSGDNARTPKGVSEWVTYDGTSDDVVTLQGKETKEISTQFRQPLYSRFYSTTNSLDNYIVLEKSIFNIVTEIKALNPKTDSLRMSELNIQLADLQNKYNSYPIFSNIERDVINKINGISGDGTLSANLAAASDWQNTVKHLMDLKLIQDDHMYEFATAFKETNPDGNVHSYSRIRWTIKISPNSK